MLDVKGFRGFRFQAERVGTLDKVITPPYDVINDEERRGLAAQSPHNMTHVLLPEAAPGDESPYAGAARTLESWIAESALVKDDANSFYLFEQEFTDMEDYVHIRRGFFAATKLPEPDEGIVLGHERTFAGPVEDRLRLTEATRANLGAIFVLYDDAENALGDFLAQMAERAPDMTAKTFDGTTQRIWCVPENDAVMAFFRDKKVYIADGHHRFHTAGVYRDAMRAQEEPDGLRPYDNVLMGFVAFQDPGLRIYPPHRLVPHPAGYRSGPFLDALKQWFHVQAVEDNLPARLKAQEGCALGLAIKDVGTYLLTLRDIDRVEMLGDEQGAAWRDLDVAVLHKGIIERILKLPSDTKFEYEYDADKALAAVDEGKHGFAFLLKAVQPKQIRACAEAGDPMPQKATYFFPKLPSGAVIHRLV